MLLGAIATAVVLLLQLFGFGRMGREFVKALPTPGERASARHEIGQAFGLKWLPTATPIRGPEYPAHGNCGNHLAFLGTLHGVESQSARGHFPLRTSRMCCE